MLSPFKFESLMNVITLNINDAQDAPYDITEALDSITHQSYDRNLWVYESETDQIWFRGRHNDAWESSPLDGAMYYMTHLFHNNTLTEFEGTNTLVYNYMKTI